MPDDELLGLRDLIDDLRQLRDDYAPLIARVSVQVPLGPAELLTVSLTGAEIEIRNSAGGSLTLPEER